MNRIPISFFYRRPRINQNFSIEFIFDEIRRQLSDKIDGKVVVAKAFNTGLLSKIINIMQAAFSQSNYINHITGEIHYINLLIRRKTVVLTIHDCGMIERQRGIFRILVSKIYLTWPVKNSRVVIAVSEHTKSEIVKYTGCNAESIKVIPVFVDKMYQSFPKLFRTEKPCILHIGTAQNKNLPRLIDALVGIPCKLVVVGELGTTDLALLRERSIDFSNYVKVPSDILLRLYCECDIVAFVSIFEGFGMPILEAQAVGRPVLTSNVSSMPEVAGEGACLVNPFDISEIRAGILRIINDGNYRNHLISIGYANALKFSAERISAEYLKIYSEILKDA